MAHGVLSDALDALRRDHAELGALEDDAGGATFAQIARLRDDFLGSLAPVRGRRVGVQLEPSAAWIAAVAALEQLSAETFLLSPDLAPDRVAATRRAMRLAGVLDASGFSMEGSGADEPGGVPGDAAVTLLTSGTTGAPKAVRHTWRTLSAPVRVDARFAGTRWLLGYPLQLYAGLQVFLQCFLNAGTLIPAPRGATPVQICELMRKRRVEYAAGTPSFWRRLLAFGSPEALRSAPLRQLSLGGETATDDVLTALRSAFPDARIVHIYATSELGRCFSVSDGRAGFPAEWLRRSPERGTELRVVDGELQIRSANAMLGYDPLSGIEGNASDWFPTGDLVNVVDDRVVFRGRRTDMINVGGNKVHALEVENAIRELACVAEVRVYPVASSIAGELVAADIVPAPGHGDDELRREVAAHCARTLTPQQRPRRIRVVPHLELGVSGKIVRRQT